MSYIIVGLGNPGEEYENTRHNTGRIILEHFRQAVDLPEWQENQKLKTLISDGKVGKEKVTLLCPNTFMNKSGQVVTYFVKNKKQAEQLVVIHDDLDIPFGKYKISFNKSAGGHRGVQSIIKAIKTESFVRIRVGISGSTASGKIKKPAGEKAVLSFILAKFKPAETLALKKMSKDITEALKVMLEKGRETAMSQFN